MSMWQVEQGDCLDLLATLAPESVDLIVTDPPYGISFMGKRWDKALPSTEVFEECLRVLKPGAFAFVMSGVRLDQLYRMAAKLEQAGFWIHFSPIWWCYASGFPKAQNIAKFIEKRHREPDSIEEVKGLGGMTSDKGYNVTKHHQKYDSFTHPDAQRLQGSFGGFQPKPALEAILVAMKPMDEKTFVAQALKNCKGITWLDDCRIPVVDETVKGPDRMSSSGHTLGKFDHSRKGETVETESRFPANLLCSDDILNDGRIVQSAGNKKETSQDKDKTIFGNANKHHRDLYGDSGSFSRYFDLDAWFAEKLKTMPDAVQRCFPCLIVPKPSKAEKNKGCDYLPEQQTKGGGGLNNTDDDVCGKYGSIKAKQRNPHPTVKPVKLMSYLIELGSRKGDLVVDPYAGSGTTGVAAVLLQRDSLCFELNPGHAEVARARISKWAEYVQDTLF